METDSKQFSPAPPLADTTSTETPSIKSNWRVKAAIVGAGLLLVALFGGVIFLLTRNPAFTANLRDIIIIMVALIGLLIMIIIGAILIVLVYYIQSLVAMLRDEIKPVLMQVNQTVNTVRGTTTLVSDNIAKPVIKVAGFMAGVKAAGQTLRAKVDNTKRN